MAIELISEIVQKNNNSFPILDSNNIRGGVYSVSTIEERDAIPAERRKIGMLCYVENEDEYYKLEPKGWEEAKFGGSGIQMYTDSQLKELEEENDIPNEYIHIPNPNELNIVQNGSSYLDIIFKTLRALQSEVSKLKNSFNYGITSYNDTMTAMSSTINDNVQEEEPLWAIDPEDLSEISDASVIIGENDLIGPDLELFDNYTQIKSTAYKEFYSLLDFESCPENKLCVYTKGILKTNGNISLELKDEDDNTLTIDLGNHISKNSFRNILIVLNRQVLNEDTEEFSGVNYLYLQVTDSQGNVLQNGYIDQDSIISDNIKYLNTRYYISKITFQELDLYKCNFYVKDSSFTNEGNGLSTLPDDSDFKFGAAHLAIRSVKTKEVLTQVSSRLLNNELVFVESENQLYIKNQNQIISLSSGSSIGGGDNNNNTMTEQEILQLLKNAGIITADNELNSVKLNDIEQLTFTHSESGQKFNVHVNADGELLVDNITSPIQPDTSTESAMVFRGAAGKYSLETNFEHTQADQILYGMSNNPQAFGDRIRFGSWYVPIKNQTVFNCSHDFIELANCGTFDYPLEGSRLYVVKGDVKTIESNNYLVNAKLYKFILKGSIKAGSTYVIRGKKHSTENKVLEISTYDYELRSHYVQNAPINNDDTPFILEDSTDLFSLDGALALILLNQNDNESLKLKYLSLPNNTENYIISSFSQSLFEKIKSDEETPAFNYKVFNQLLDCVLLKDSTIFREGTVGKVFGEKNYTSQADTLVKDSFELDPSRQGFLSLTTKNLESTNTRCNKINEQLIPLSNKNISFFHTEAQFPVSNYEPKSSKYNKTICTDKSRLNLDKPNMVSCFFGINMQTTRCFNWVSVPERNEYIWIRKKGENEWINRFESYKGHSSEIANTNDVYEVGKMNRVKYTNTVINAAYKRMTGVFPGSEYPYCAHKCVVYIQDAPTSDPETYEYIVGPTLLNGKPNLAYTSNIQTFTLYPSSYTPLVYQISDQQGFNWIEYQVWAAAAKQILNQINSECTSNSKLFPVLINTGDCTQNGTRYNEWLDYYEAGYCLFDHIEQLNVVGNNDLANAFNHAALGTGNDEGKSNPYYFHLVNCYEVDNSSNYVHDESASTYDKFWQHPLIVNNVFFPSTYYCYFDNFGYLLLNSELTVKTCEGLFKTIQEEGIYNLYTGYLENDNKLSDTEMWNRLNFANTIKNMLIKLNDKNIIVACHEMPFTVITEAYLKTTAGRPGSTDRSCTCMKGLPTATHTSLIGSHMNRIDFRSTWDLDNNYWFSKLLQDNGVSLCIGGHKHSYTSTFPIIEMNEELWEIVYNNIQEEDDKNLVKLLENSEGNLNYSKLFLIIDDKIKSNNVKNLSTQGYYPMFGCNRDKLQSMLNGTSFSSITPVVYFMCQATGFKLKSNKELPSVNQSFSIIKPKSQEGAAHISQESPMFATIKFNNLENAFDISLYRIVNIKKTTAAKITEFSYNKESKKPMVTEQLILGTLVSNQQNDDGSINKNKVVENYWFTSSPKTKYDFDYTDGSSDRCWISGEDLKINSNLSFSEYDDYDEETIGNRVYPYFNYLDLKTPNITLRVTL